MIEQHCMKINSKDENVKALEQWLNYFVQEIELYSKKTMEYEPWRLYTERPMLGLFAAGIIRNDPDREICIMQEFVVHNPLDPMKRCDLFIVKNRTAYLIEAKFDEGYAGDTYWDVNKHKNKLDTTYSQLEQYYNYESKAYDSYDAIYLVVLHFYNVKKKSEEDFKKHCNDAKNIELTIPNEFYTLISLKDRKDSDYVESSGLEIYGYVVNKTSGAR